MKNRTKILMTLIILIIGAVITSILFFNRTLTGQVIQDDTDRLNTFTYTKAICNESNFCQDYEITCEKNHKISITPLTGAVIQHSENWQDPRTKENIERLC